MKRIKSIWLLMLVIAISLMSVACNSTETAPNSTESTTEPVTQLSGKVVVDGSGTVYPLMAHIAEEYMVNEQPDVSVEVGRVGSSAGFKKFVVGELDLSDASRAMKTSEMESFVASGYSENDVLEIKIALDGLTIVINNDNTWAKEMTKDEIINMYLSGFYKENDQVLWSDIRAEWPSEEIKFYGPNENHGTFEFFYEVILGKKEMVKTANLEQEYSTLVDLVSRDKNAIAFFGFGYYVNNKDKIQAVKVDFGNGPVEPTLNTIGEDLAYAGFTRPVFTYVNLKFAKEKPQVLDFAKYVVSANGATKLAGENGFAPLPASVYNSYLEVLQGLE
ncbi:MAG: PstS family phosphate ABC transporter substrate-binding protein [Clostridia bacterium]|nr:PstS family phosphate ABC transporter substrate-binding protein [Clostridia bacterium]